MRLKSWTKAHPALTEALKQKRDSWKVVENLMVVCIALGRWRETAQHMNTLLDLRVQSQRPVHIDELRHLAFITSSMAQREAKASTPPLPPSPPLQRPLPLLASTPANEDMAEEEDDDDYSGRVELSAPLSEPAKSVEALLLRIVSILPSDPEVWDILATFQHVLGRFNLELEARVKQVSLMGKSEYQFIHLLEYSSFEPLSRSPCGRRTKRELRVHKPPQRRSCECLNI